MKRYMLALAALATLAAGAATVTTTAKAVEFGVGPGGVYVGEDRPYYRDHYYRDYDRGCRVVITHRANRYGEDVEIRHRVCD